MYNQNQQYSYNVSHLLLYTYHVSRVFDVCVYVRPRSLSLSLSITSVSLLNVNKNPLYTPWTLRNRWNALKSCSQHLRWSSRYLDEPPPRVSSRWSSRQRLSSFGHASEDFPEHMASQLSLNRLSIPVPGAAAAHRRPSRGSLYSLVDCLKAHHELPETQPLFPETADQAVMKETVLDSPPAHGHNRRSLKRQKTTADEERRQLTPAEMKRKTFLRKISLQETHINYNQDYWLEYDKSTRFHASLDLGYLKSHENDIAIKHCKDTGPTATVKPQLEQIQEPTVKPNHTIISRQSDLPYSKTKRANRLFLRGDSEPQICNKKCSCNEHEQHSEKDSNNSLVFHSSSNLLANAIRSPSTENLPFLERIGQIETEFETDSYSRMHGSNSSDSSNAFSDISLHLQSTTPSPKSMTFDFNGGSAFFGEGVRTDSMSSMSSLKQQSQQQSDFSPNFHIPEVSVTHPSNSPSPRSSFVEFKWRLLYTLP